MQGLRLGQAVATVKSEDLDKVQPPAAFPKLGLEDRRETPIVNDPQSLKVKQMAIANAQHAPASDIAGRKAVGQAVSVPGRNVSYASGNELRPDTERGQDPKSPIGTQQHENLHLLFNRVGEKHGHKARLNLAHNIYNAIPPEHRQGLQNYVASKYGKKAIDPKLWHEEHLAHLLNYLNTPSERDVFHRTANHTDEDRFHFNVKMKEAYRAVQAASKQADNKWLSRIITKSEHSEFSESTQWEPNDEDLDLALNILRRTQRRFTRI